MLMHIMLLYVSLLFLNKSLLFRLLQMFLFFPPIVPLHLIPPTTVLWRGRGGVRTVSLLSNVIRPYLVLIFSIFFYLTYSDLDYL